MKFTKLEHSGCVIEKDGWKIVCDPVEFMATLPELDNVAAVVITHKHGDHLQPEKIAAIRDRNPEMRVLVVADAVSEVPDAEIMKSGDNLEIKGIGLEFFGGDHAAIVPGEIPCQNLGVIVDGLIVNPGDSFDIPDGIKNPEVLLVPSAVPWCKLAESMEYIKEVRPKLAVPVHNAVLSELGNGFNNNWLRMACEEVGAELAPLSIGESIEI